MSNIGNRTIVFTHKMRNKYLIKLDNMVYDTDDLNLSVEFKMDLLKVDYGLLAIIQSLTYKSGIFNKIYETDSKNLANRIYNIINKISEIKLTYS